MMMIMSMWKQRVAISFIFVAFSFILQPIECFLLQGTSTAANYIERCSQLGRMKRPMGKNDDDNNSIEHLLKQAEKLRKEVNIFEQKKEDEINEARRIQQGKENQKQSEYMRYSAEVPILKSDGSEVMERVQFLPRFMKGNNKSKIITVQAALPLGLILSESEDLPGLTIVDEVAEGSNAEVAGVKVGDLLRACTACQVSMDMPTWQLMAGGIGRPKTSRMMYSTDGRRFEEVMEALVSNRMDPNDRPVWLVLERMEK